MPAAAFQPSFDALPAVIPVFPLAGALLLPGGRLPLQVFEPRYLAMTLDSLAAGRMFGMVQPRGPAADAAEPPLYDIGCLGRVVQFAEAEDGRLFITLTGVCRFRIVGEEAAVSGYRRVRADYDPFHDDLETGREPALDRERLFAGLAAFFQRLEVEPDWQALKAARNGHLVTALATLCPFEPSEKQALLEAPTAQARAEVLTALVELAANETHAGGSRQ